MSSSGKSLQVHMARRDRYREEEAEDGEPANHATRTICPQNSHKTFEVMPWVMLSSIHNNLLRWMGGQEARLSVVVRLVHLKKKWGIIINCRLAVAFQSHNHISNSVLGLRIRLNPRNNFSAVLFLIFFFTF